MKWYRPWKAAIVTQSSVITIATPWIGVEKWHRVVAESYPKLSSGWVLYWRWPWEKAFRVRRWIKAAGTAKMPLYQAMDIVYMRNAAYGMGAGSYGMLELSKELIAAEPKCVHVGIENASWIAACPKCGEKALKAAQEAREQLADAKLEIANLQETIREMQEDAKK